MMWNTTGKIALCPSSVGRIVFLAGLVLLAGCAKDSIGPEPAPVNHLLAISYLDVSGGNLKYDEKDGEYWENPEVVDSQANVGHYSSLVLDAQGVPHIAYRDQTNMDLKYVTRSQDGWYRTTVDYAGNVGARCAIAVDAQGNPQISYLEASPEVRVKWACKVGEAWLIETIPGDQPYLNQTPCRVDYGYTTSIAVDGNGNPHICYYTVIGKLAYAVRNSEGVWQQDFADSVGNVGLQCSLVLDAQGNPHVCYQTYPSFRIKYSSKISGAWQTETITVGDPAHSCAHYTDLALDSQGNVHISFQTSNSALGYLTKRGGADWSFEIVDESSSNIGLYSSIVIDAQGIPHISYYDYQNGKLKSAVRTGNGWATTVLDENGNVGMYSSMAAR